MTKYLIILITSVIALNSSGQSLRKDINFVEEGIHFIKLIRPISEKRVVCVTEGETYIRVYLYDKEFNELGMKEILKKEEVYLYHFRLKDNYLHISNAVKAYDGLALMTIFLDPGFKTIERVIEETIWVGDYHISASGKNTLYSVSKKNFYLLNNETEDVTWINPELEKKETAIASKFISFKDNNKLVVFRSKKKGMSIKREVALYNENGKELLFFPKLENDKNKTNVYPAANNEDIYFIGNYKDSPSKKDILYSESPSTKPNHTGIYIKNTSLKNAYEQFYPYSDFKEFSEKVNLDKNVKDFDKFNVGLEKLVFLENETVAFCTIYQDILSSEYSQRYGKVRTGHIGRELKYILTFGLNSTGELLWDKVIPLNKNILESNEKDGMFNNKFLTVEEIENTIKCHYSFNDKINSFEINNGQISNQQEVNYTKIPLMKSDIGYQYLNSSYWYDNYYLSWYEYSTKEAQKSDNRVYFDKIEFKK